jgi:predicted GIY-YIG superfamily endonuclease
MTFDEVIESCELPADELLTLLEVYGQAPGRSVSDLSPKAREVFLDLQVPQVQGRQPERRYLPNGLKSSQVPTDVYVLEDVQGRTLYIGISLNAASRLSSHRVQPWWHEVALIYVHHHPNRADALAHEKQLHELMQPLYSVA